MFGMPNGNATSTALNDALSDETLTRVVHNGTPYAVSGREVCDYFKEKLGIYNTEDVADHITAKISGYKPYIQSKREEPFARHNHNFMLAPLLRSNETCAFNDVNGIGDFNSVQFGSENMPYNPIALSVRNPEYGNSTLSSFEMNELEKGLDDIIKNSSSKQKNVIAWADGRGIRLLTKVLIILDDDSMAMRLKPKLAGLIMALGDDAARLMLASPAAMSAIDKNQIVSLAMKGRTAHIMGVSENPYVGMLPEHVLIEIAKNNNPEIRAILIGNRNARRSLPTNILADGITDDSCIVRKASAASVMVADKIPKPVVASLFKDPEHVVWTAACKNLDAILAADENEIDEILSKHKKGAGIIADTIKKANPRSVPASHIRRFMHLQKLCENGQAEDY